MGGSWFQADPGKKFIRPPSQPMTGHGGALLSSPAVRGSRNKRTVVLANLE
jgi:hypothetical protein